VEVKIIIQPSGLRNGQPWPPRGGVIDLPDDEAVRMIEQRLVVPAYDPDSRVERAVPPMTAVEARVEVAAIEAEETQAKALSAMPPVPAKRVRKG
jgi:hypothetical protein